MKKAFTGRLFEDDRVNWLGLTVVLCFAGLLIWSFPRTQEFIRGNAPDIEVKRQDGIVCAKPRHTTERAWSCWEEKKLDGSRQED